ncbi:hypothetical protein HZA97_10020 [Candidatus Woesearchaeota archaeon]|nr:hypothetical protein [Candidatus Woesearchaeota archaeon]
MMMQLPFKLENVFERKIARDTEWVEGIFWGEPREGHPEGIVAAHVKEVLDNIDKLGVDKKIREDLRIIALIHDAFKYKVDESKKRIGENHHGTIARRFAEKYVTNPEILNVVSLHDEAYHAWIKGKRHDDWRQAEIDAQKLIKCIKNIKLYLLFYDCDNNTGDKTRESYVWFKELVANNH